MSLDLSAYAGRWLALIDDQIVGVGQTAAEAKRFAQRNRPKERTVLRFVEPAGGELLPLSPLLERIRPYLFQQEQPVYLVGGAVRDALLGRVSHDLDFIVPQEAIKLAFAVGDALGLPAYVLDRQRDTGRVVWPDKGTTLDFARFRAPDLASDLRDRDFTINAMAVPATAQTTASLIDPCQGQADLQQRLVRLTHDEAINHDPVRALRALRLALGLDFTLTAETTTAVKAARDRLHTVSAERIRDELLKLMQTAVPHQAIHRMRELTLLDAVLPEIAVLADVAQSAPHHEPVLAHTVTVLRWLVQVETAVTGEDEVAHPALIDVQRAFAEYGPSLAAHLERDVDGGLDGRTLLRLGALFHDAGKAETQTIEAGGRIRFLGHDKVGAKLAARRLRRLALSNEAIHHVQRIVAGHMRPLLLVQAQGARPTGRAVYRFFRDIGSAGLDVGLLALADHLATHWGATDDSQWADLMSLVTELYHHYFERQPETVSPPPLLDGRELMAALHLQPGPEVGRLLRLIEEAQAAGEVTTPEEAIQFAQRCRQ